MRAKSQGEHTADQRQQSPEEYAQGEVQQGVSGAVDRANGTAQRTARMWSQDICKKRMVSIMWY